MAKVKFVSGATSLEFNVSISYPARRPIQKMQILDRTAAGSLRVESYGVTVKTFPLNFVDIPKTDYLALVDFFDNTANGALNFFIYHDENGTTWNVRFVMDTLDFSQTAVNRYSGAVDLEVIV